MENKIKVEFEKMDKEYEEDEGLKKRNAKNMSRADRRAMVDRAFQRAVRAIELKSSI
jgi:hypothetical protein